MKSSTAVKVETALRVFLGLLLLWAAVSKLAKPVDFLASIYAYEMPLPRSFLRLVAVVLPWMELLCGLLLVSATAVETALICTTGMLVVFVIATAQAWIRGLSISCGCFDLTIFGLGQRFPDLITFIESVGFAFFRNLVLTGIAVFLLRKRLSVLALAATAPQPSPREALPRLSKQQRRAAASR